MIIRPEKYNRGNIYLSGAIQFTSDYGAGWREKLSPKLLNLGYFPLDISDLDIAYHNHAGKPTVVSDDKLDLLEYKAQMRKHFIDTDLELIKNLSDAVIVFYDENARKGAGTISETQFAYNQNLPVFLVCEDYETEYEVYKNCSGWLLGLTTKIFLSFDSLLEYLDSYLPHGILIKDRYGNYGTGNKYLCSLSGEVFTKNEPKFVSKITPLLSKDSVSITNKVYESTEDRLTFFLDYLTEKYDTNFSNK